MQGLLERQRAFAAKVEQRERYYKERVLMDIMRDDPQDLQSFIAECDATDLHQFDVIHGVEQEIPLFEAILDHPRLDRATALNIFSACQPGYYDKEMASGRTAGEFDEPEDQIFLHILRKAHTRLSRTQGWRGKFEVTLARNWEKQPRTSPANYIRFVLSPSVLRPTQNQTAKSLIIYEQTSICLSLDAWKMKN